ncbi:alginate export family protein [bacterium]|nr:alginate export family protein [bacterium]
MKTLYLARGFPFSLFIFSMSFLYFPLSLSPFLPFSLPANAQISEEELRRERIETTEDLRRTEELTAAALRARRDKRGWLFDYGGNSSFAYTGSNDNDRDRTTPDSQDHSWDYEVNLFSVLSSVDRRTKFYARTRTLYTETKKNSPAIRGSDFNNAKIDMAYFERKFEGAALKHTLTLGRQFSMVGRGIAYGLTADGIYWESKGRKMTASLLFMRQKPGDNNIDALSPGSGRTKRWFWGAEYNHKFRSWAKLGVYTLWNKDRNTEQAYSTGAGTQRHRFDSQYYGLGLDGTFFKKLKYWSEFIMARGKTYDDANSVPGLMSSKVNVDAEALDVGLRYLFGGDLAPTLYTEYAYGSGDADRSNASSSRGGSSFGDDSLFRSFGGLSMGNALSPSLANIRILKAGASVKPFARMGARWNDMSFQVTAYTYWTAAPGGATSDPAVVTSAAAAAAVSDNDIGDEYDAVISWKFFDDVKYQFKFGFFQPGPAYRGLRGSEEYFKLKVSFDL